MLEDHKIEARPKNWLVPVALVTLREKNSHGYELIQRLAKFGFEAINPGTLYRALRQMEKKGLCKAEWETSKGGRARRVYSITNDGEEHLNSWVEGCKKWQKVMKAFSLAYACR